LKDKLISFCQTDATTKIVLSWLKGENEQLKAHEMTLNLRWSAVIKSFRLK